MAKIELSRARFAAAVLKSKWWRLVSGRREEGGNDGKSETAS